MANLPSLHTSGLPGQTPREAAATTSPARGAEMRNFLQSRLLAKNRAPPLVHSWDFWHDRQDKRQTNGAKITSTVNSTTTHGNYEDRLEILANVDDVRKFWNVFNNFDLTQLQLRDSIHLFHKGVKPAWEDARNVRGGSWTFRVPKAQASDFWKEICMMAIGEQLQQAVESERTTFRDDICGVSLGVRFNSMLVQIWNRDGTHEQGIEMIRKVVVQGLSENLRPKEGTYYYKKHSEHAGFTGSTTNAPSSGATAASARNVVNGYEPGPGMQSLNAVVEENTSS